MPEPLLEEAQRVYKTVRAAAAGPCDGGRAELSLTSARRLYGAGDYDCPVVVLSPVNPGAARVVVEVQEGDVWWLITDDGPGTELYAGTERDRHAQLDALVRAVVSGRYTHGPGSERRMGIFRRRVLRGWGETFETEDGPFTSEHFGRGAPDRLREFVPY